MMLALAAPPSYDITLGVASITGDTEEAAGVSTALDSRSLASKDVTPEASVVTGSLTASLVT